jgi:hypothetical protein
MRTTSAALGHREQLARARSIPGLLPAPLGISTSCDSDRNAVGGDGVFSHATNVFTPSDDDVIPVEQNGSRRGAPIANDPSH